MMKTNPQLHLRFRMRHRRWGSAVRLFIWMGGILVSLASLASAQTGDLRRAERLLEHRLYGEAIREFNARLSTSANDAHALRGLALAWEGIGDRGFVKRYISRALYSLPDDLDLIVLYGHCLTEVPDSAEKGLDCYRRALSLSGDSALFQKNLMNYYNATGKCKKAIELAKHALRWKKYAVYVNNNLGNAFLNCGEPDEAVKVYRRALALDRKDHLVAANLAHAYRVKSERDVAKQWYLRAIELNPEYAKAYVHLAEMYFEEKSPDSSSLFARAMLDRVPGYWPAARWQLKSLLAKGRTGQAEELTSTLIALSPEDAKLSKDIAEVYAESDFSESGIKWAKRAIELDPLMSDAYAILARLYSAVGNHQESIKVYRNAAAQFPHQAAATLANMSNEYMNMQDFDGAIEACQEALRINPREHFAHFQIGVAREHKGDKAGAIEEFLKIEGDDVLPFLAAAAIGRIHVSEGKCDEAIPFLRKVVQAGVNVPDAYRSLAGCLTTKGESKEALELLDVAITMEPKNIDGYLLKAQVLSNDGKHEQGREYLTMALRIDPGSAVAHELVGDSYMRQKRHDEATNAYNKALGCSADDQVKARIHIGLGNAFAGKGDEASKLKHYRKAASLGHRGVKEWLQQNGLSETEGQGAGEGGSSTDQDWVPTFKGRLASIRFYVALPNYTEYGKRVYVSAVTDYGLPSLNLEYIINAPAAGRTLNYEVGYAIFDSGGHLHARKAFEASIPGDFTGVIAGFNVGNEMPKVHGKFKIELSIDGKVVGVGYISVTD